MVRANTPDEVHRLSVQRPGAGDAAGMAELHEPDAVLAHPQSRPVQGRSAIRAVYEGVLSSGARMGLEPALPQLTGSDLASAMTRRADGEGVRVQVLCRQPDGAWLRVIDAPEVPGPPAS